MRKVSTNSRSSGGHSNNRKRPALASAKTTRGTNSLSSLIGRSAVSPCGLWGGAAGAEPASEQPFRTRANRDQDEKDSECRSWPPAMDVAGRYRAGRCQLLRQPR